MRNNKMLQYKQVAFTEGFWANRQKINQVTTVNAVYNRFKETGRFYAMTLKWREGESNRPHVFYDSDTAKWIEGAAYSLYNKPNQDIENKIEELIDFIEQGMADDGYYNSYYLTIEKYKRWTNRDHHELYCAGHLMEAAVAYYEATGRDRFLKLMEKFANHIYKIFIEMKVANFETCGHEEIELALVRMWHATGKMKYLEMAKHFIDKRGKREEDLCFDWFSAAYAQDQCPVRDQIEAEGHVVRFTYLFSAAIDIAREYKDEKLLEACKKVWEDVVTHKMYITGGVGSLRHGEAFGPEYYLPNDEAYTETCVSIGMAMMASRLLTVEPHGHYGDILELQAYNGVLAGVSLDGERFFYENPLEIVPRERRYMQSVKAAHRPIVRVKVFGCSCCPPNLLRFIESIGGYFYTVSEDCIYINLYDAGRAQMEIGGAKVELIQETRYPWNGKIEINVKINEPKEFSIALRLPAWCHEPKVSCGNEVYSVENGYAIFRKQWMNEDKIYIDLPMEVKEIEAHPLVTAASGKIALMRGPIVYCLEEQENGAGITDIAIDSQVNYQAVWRPELLDGVVAIQFIGKKRDRSQWKQKLYREWVGSYQEQQCTAIPYYSWANRGEQEMTVWIKKIN